jgi:hypothetical protein
MPGQSRDNALDHVIVVLFENRSLDNVLGRLYRPGDGKTFEGVTGKDLTNPIPEWAEHGADRKVVPYAVATDMDSPNPDSGEEYPHTNTQLFNIQNEHHRFKLGEEITEPYNAPEPGQTPTMDGYVTDYISSRLKDRFATHFVPFARFEADAAAGDLPDFSFIEPALGVGHNDYHPACGRAMGHGIAIQSIDPPSSILGGEAFLARLYNAYKAMQSPTGPNVWNTALLIGWDEPGGTYDHVPPPSVPPPDPSAPVGQDGFTFDRSGYRVPAIIVSPWVAEGEVFNEEHRHTSLIATLREQWGLGDPFTARDAAARRSPMPSLSTPRETRPRGLSPIRGRCLRSWRMRQPWARACPRWARPWPRGYGSTRSRTMSRSRACPRTPRPTCPPSRCCLCCGTSWPPSSPCWPRPLRTRAPRPDPGVRQP